MKLEKPLSWKSKVVLYDHERKDKEYVHLAGNYCHSHLNSISDLTLQNAQTGCTLNEDAKVAFWYHSCIFLIPCQCSFRSNEYRWNFRFVKILWVMIFADLAECPVYAKISFRNSSETIVHLKRINLLVRHNKIIADVPNITPIKFSGITNFPLYFEKENWTSFTSLMQFMVVRMYLLRRHRVWNYFRSVKTQLHNVA